MIMRALAIALCGFTIWGLWFCYTQIGILRGTSFWEFRYVVFTLAAFLWLSGLESGLGWLSAKLAGRAPKS